MDMQQVGARLKALRKGKNITQEELAEKLGVSNRTVSRWENGRNMPDFDLLVQISQFYNSNIDYLLTGESKIPEDENIEYRIAEYTNDEKILITKILHRTFIAGLICSIVYIIGQFWDYSNPFTDFLRGFGMGGSTGSLLCGAIFTGKYGSKFRNTKKRLLSKFVLKENSNGC